LKVGAFTDIAGTSPCFDASLLPAMEKQDIVAGESNF
jgi:mannose/fructose-specific phosphotransferase system component IIA